MIDIDINKIENIIKQAAKEKVIPRFKSLQTDEIMTKSNPDDFVTIADKEAEEFISNELKSLYPDAFVLGEESVFENKKLLELLKSDQGVFVIDPVDGTRNFKDGKNEFGVMLSYAKYGQIQAGWIYLPMYNSMLVTQKGSGTYINGARQKITDENIDISDASGSCYGHNKCFIEHVNHIDKTRCSAYVYTNFIENKLDFITHISKTIYPWDHMAGVLAAVEAGGFAKIIGKKEYDYSRTDERLIVAKNEILFDKISDLVNKFL